MFYLKNFSLLTMIKIKNLLNKKQPLKIKKAIKKDKTHFSLRPSIINYLGSKKKKYGNSIN